MKLDNALITALIAIGFFTSEVSARQYVGKLDNKVKHELLNITVSQFKDHRKIEKDAPWGPESKSK